MVNVTFTLVPCYTTSNMKCRKNSRTIMRAYMKTRIMFKRNFPYTTSISYFVRLFTSRTTTTIYVRNRKTIRSTTYYASNSNIITQFCRTDKSNMTTLSTMKFRIRTFTSFTNMTSFFTIRMNNILFISTISFSYNFFTFPNNKRNSNTTGPRYTITNSLLTSPTTKSFGLFPVNIIRIKYNVTRIMTIFKTKRSFKNFTFAPRSTY